MHRRRRRRQVKSGRFFTAAAFVHNKKDEGKSREEKKSALALLEWNSGLEFSLEKNPSRGDPRTMNRHKSWAVDQQQFNA